MNDPTGIWIVIKQSDIPTHVISKLKEINMLLFLCLYF